MKTYGTIPTSTQPDVEEESSGDGLAFISRAKARGKSLLTTRRSWKEMIHRHAFSLPHGVGDAYLRIRTNLAYFSMNYAIIALGVVFLSLLLSLISLIVFIFMMAAWLFLYFLRDEPLVVFHRAVSDQIVLAVLAVVTIVALLLTGATMNVVWSVAAAVLVVLIHAVVRRTEDLCLDEEVAGGGGGGGWYTVVENPSAPSSSSSYSK